MQDSQQIFKLHSEYQPTGDQPQAIEKLVKGFKEGNQFETLLGVTGSGKTFTMANVIQQLNKPTLIIAHNKTLAAQLYGEMKEFFPHNAVEYFVSYYDYYQPEAVDAAMMLASYYHERGIEVDTVLCLYETQALGAYLAHELQRANMLNPNPDSTVYVLGPEYDAQGNIIFRDNLRKLIDGKRVLLLISCITSGKTIERAMESVNYYGGEAVGISAVFSAIDEVDGVSVNSIFTKDDVPGYEAYPAHDCPLCRENKKVDAITNGYGYSLL